MLLLFHPPLQEEAHDTHSHASSDPDPVRELERSEQAALREEMFVQALVCRKTVSVLQELRRLAFANWQAAAAVQVHGSDIVACISWLLERGEADADALSTAAAAAVSNAPRLPEVDVSEELRTLAAVQAGLGLGLEALQQAVVDALGDVSAAVEAMMAAAGNSAGSSAGARMGTPASSSGSVGRWAVGGLAGNGILSSIEAETAVASWRSSCSAVLQADPSAGQLGTGVSHGLGLGLGPFGGTGSGGGGSRLSSWVLGGAASEPLTASPSASPSHGRGGSALLGLLGAASEGGSSVAGHSDGGFTLHDWVPSSSSQRTTLDSSAAPQPAVGSHAAGEEGTSTTGLGNQRTFGAGFTGFSPDVASRSLFGGFSAASSSGNDSSL